MSTTTTAPKMILTATGHGHHHYDDATLRAWYCDEGDAGRWLVICGREVVLAIGDTREEALAEAARCNGGEPVEEREADDETRVEVVQIVGTPVETLRAALVAAFDQSRQHDEIVRIDVCDLEAATAILESLADEAGEEIETSDRRRGTVREVLGAVDAGRSAWWLEMCQR